MRSCNPRLAVKTVDSLTSAPAFCRNFGPRTAVFAKFVKNDAAAAIGRQFPIQSLFSTESLTNSLPSHQCDRPPRHKVPALRFRPAAAHAVFAGLQGPRVR